MSRLISNPYEKSMASPTSDGFDRNIDALMNAFTESVDFDFTTIDNFTDDSFNELSSLTNNLEIPALSYLESPPSPIASYSPEFIANTIDQTQSGYLDMLTNIVSNGMKDGAIEFLVGNFLTEMETLNSFDNPAYLTKYNSGMNSMKPSHFAGDSMQVNFHSRNNTFDALHFQPYPGQNYQDQSFQGDSLYYGYKNEMNPGMYAGRQHSNSAEGVDKSQKEFLCETCQQHFSRIHDLKRHILTHTKSKPHRCPHCNKGFSRKDALLRHAKDITDGKKEACPVRRPYTKRTRSELDLNAAQSQGLEYQDMKEFSQGYSQFSM